MANTSSQFPFLGIFLGIWLMGMSVSCYVAAMLFAIVITPYEPIAFLIFTIVGAVCLVVGIGCLLLPIKKITSDPINKVAGKFIVLFIVLTIISDAILIVVANV